MGELSGGPPNFSLAANPGSRQPTLVSQSQAVCLYQLGSQGRSREALRGPVAFDHDDRTPFPSYWALTKYSAV